MPIIPAVPLIVHRHIYVLHHPPHHQHTARRETATSPRYSYALTPNAHISWQKALLLYYLVVYYVCNTLYVNILDALYMNPKGSQVFCFDDWISILDTSWTYLGHALQPHKEPCNRKYTPYFAPKCRFSSAVNATKKSQILLSGLQCKKSDFLNTFRV